MSKYTTGEVAKLCEVTVRTVQYYDTRGLLIPSELSEGGRRLYSDDDVRKLRSICFLRKIGLSINSIAALLTDENADVVIGMLLEQQARLLRAEMEDRRTKLHAVERLAQELRNRNSFSVETIGDIAHTMNHQNQLRRVHLTMLMVGILMDVLEVGALLLWIFKGVWQPFAVCIPVVILCGVLLVRLYYRKTAYLCPRCHAIFRPGFREFLFSAHTPKTRKLSCVKCGYHGFCVETCDQADPAQ